MDSATNNMGLRNENIELTEITPNLQQIMESAENVDRSEILNSSELGNQKQVENESVSVTSLQLKRRREFETKYKLVENQSKLDETTITVQEERPQNEVKTPMAQIPEYPLTNIESREHDSAVALLEPQSIEIKPENEPISGDFTSLLSSRMSVSDADYSHSRYRNSSITGERIDQLDTWNNLYSGQSSSLRPSSSSSVQQALYRGYPNQLIENVQGGQSSDIEIGAYGTRVTVDDLRKVNWKNVSLATRSLLPLIFSQHTLATHSLTGKPSRGYMFRGPSQKAQLDPFKVSDLTYFLQQRFNCTTSEIRKIISLKCSSAARHFFKETAERK